MGITKAELKARAEKVTQRQVDKFITNRLVMINRFRMYIDYETDCGDETSLDFNGLLVMNAIKEAIVLNQVEARAAKLAI